MKMNDAFEVVSQRKSWGVVDRRWTAEDIHGCASEVIVEVCGDNADSVLRAKKTDNRPMQMIGTRIGIG